jgi:peptide-methionine (R)-S-oxide reductase
MSIIISKTFKKLFVFTTLVFVLSFELFQTGIFQNTVIAQNHKKEKNMKFNVNKSDEEWKKILTPEQYEVLRLKGTERPFTGKYTTTTTDGVYNCAACGAKLFKSDSKFDSHCGWPSFYEAIDNGQITEIKDTTHGMTRTEVVCTNCGSHLGHVFEDGPQPTGLRYCINSISVELKKDSLKK